MDLGGPASALARPKVGDTVALAKELSHAIRGEVARFLRGAVRRQTRPVDRYDTSTEPLKSSCSTREMRREPKPTPAGSDSGGPPSSRQTKTNFDSPSWSSDVHVIDTWPLATVRAPYFKALVASSWIARDRASACRDLTTSGGPETANRPSPVLYGIRAVLITSWRGAAAQFAAVSKSCALPNAASRA